MSTALEQDGGKNWERVPLSPKLPGEPNGVVALGPSQAEMTTTTGAIYYTENAGRNWKAKVRCCAVLLLRSWSPMGSTLEVLPLNTFLLLQYLHLLLFVC